VKMMSNRYGTDVTFTKRLPNTDHGVEITVQVYGWSGNGWDEPRTLETGDVDYRWERTGREVKQSGLCAVIEGMWDLGDVEEAADDY